MIFRFQYFNLSFHYPLYTGTCPFCRLLYSSVFLLPILHFYWPDGLWICHQFSIHLALRAPIQILAIPSHILLLFIDVPGLKFFNSLNITIFEFPYFSVSVGLCYVSSSSLGCFKGGRVSFYKLYIPVVSAIILGFMGSVLVHYFAATVLMYFSGALWVSLSAGTYFPVYQSFFFISMKLLRVEFGPDSRSLNRWQT